MRGVQLGWGLLCLVLLGGVAVSTVNAQPDSVRSAILEAKGYPPDHSPRKALWRAAALPGWGQLYNRQYYKIPFVYAGLAGGGYAVYELNRRYRLYRHANLYVIGESRAEEGGENEYAGFEDEYNRVVGQVGGELGGQQLRRIRDKYRRWRDLSIVGTGLFYALTVLDAYVSAHLLAFDVGGDLAVQVRPVGGLAPALGGDGEQFSSHARGGGTGVRIRVQF